MKLLLVVLEYTQAEFELVRGGVYEFIKEANTAALFAIMPFGGGFTMNQFFSQLVADKKIKRQMKLIQTIYNANYPITLDEIAEDFGTSKRTLFRDIKELGDILPEDNVVELSTVSGYTMSGYTISQEHLIDDLITKISERSPIYMIVNNIYDEIFLTIDEWADDLFLSTSTLYRYLGHLKKVLKDFKLELTLTPVAIVGEEVNIRHFYFHFFYNTNDISSMNRPTKRDQATFQALHRFFFRLDR
ncbi:helix-turn-helix domain-containing protein [Listeria grandensis]|uniref:helix-turn-helix domain-containing protein n=1 Tax=Listeria grandensis TaxID=1494963 RepID=UPI00098D240B|nr:helix-turn-helix domain-containing protein [Listeria grandensis]